MKAAFVEVHRRPFFKRVRLSYWAFRVMGVPRWVALRGSLRISLSGTPLERLGKRL